MKLHRLKKQLRLQQRQTARSKQRSRNWLWLLLFSADWPFENIDHAAEWFDVCTIAEADRQKIGRDNSMRLFKLDI